MVNRRARWARVTQRFFGLGRETYKAKTWLDGRGSYSGFRGWYGCLWLGVITWFVLLYWYVLSGREKCHASGMEKCHASGMAQN